MLTNSNSYFLLNFSLSCARSERSKVRTPKAHSPLSLTSSFRHLRNNKNKMPNCPSEEQDYCKSRAAANNPSCRYSTVNSSHAHPFQHRKTKQHHREIGQPNYRCPPSVKRERVFNLDEPVPNFQAPTSSQTACNPPSA